MSQQDTSEEKSLPASNRKLQKLREKGSVANAPDAVHGITLATALLIVFVSAFGFVSGWADLMSLAGDNINRPLESVLSSLAPAAAASVLLPMALIMVVTAAVAALTSSLMSGGPTFSLEPMKLDFNRLNPVTGLRNIFALARWVALGRGLLVIALLLLGAVGFGVFGIGPLVLGPQCGPACIGPVSLVLLGGYIVYAVAVLLLLVVFDVPLQHWLFRHQQRMTKTEMKQENKDQYGSPEIRRARRQLAQEAAQGQRVDQSRATFLLAGDGIAVGLRYVSGETAAPVVMGKMTGEQAATVLTKARQRGLPIVEDHELAAQLVRLAPSGYPIPAALFRPIAIAMIGAGIRV
jgi:type III secretion protein U